MPIPGGDITTSEIWTTPEVIEEPKDVNDEGVESQEAKQEPKE